MWRWLREPDFAEAFARARREYLEVAISRLQRAAGQATSKLLSLLDDDDSGVALRAALGLLDRAVKGAELLDVLARLERLEQATKGREQR